MSKSILITSETQLPVKEAGLVSCQIGKSITTMREGRPPVAALRKRAFVIGAMWQASLLKHRGGKIIGPSADYSRNFRALWVLTQEAPAKKRGPGENATGKAPAGAGRPWINITRETEEMKTESIPLDERIIVALDVASDRQAREVVKRCEGHSRYFKVGLQLFMANWFHTVDWIVDRGHKVMLDLKFFDIPETVKLAVDQVNSRGVSMATVHGNDPIIRAAVQAATSMKLLAVTVLTSFGEEDMREMGMTRSVADLVYYRARRALDLGCDGVVSSGLEAGRLRGGLGEKLLIVTPGIRPGANVEGGDDQKRIVTAGAAIAGGADHLVVGRPITQADDPAAVIASMQEEIAKVLA